ncbi:MAG TPA: lipopolysaccharide heptosyltransferase II [Burkholderiales bacterium]|nr:lipopolysaccharide heptosyltransferase II [Burkholderiales bacterium]
MAAAPAAAARSARTLVVAPNWIGDAVMAQPLLARLRTQNPEAALDVLAPEWVAPVARRMPEVREVLVGSFAHGRLALGARWRLSRALRARRYAEAIVLPNSWKSALVPFLAGIPVRRGYVGEARYGLLNRRLRARGEPMPQHYARLAGPIGDALPAPRLSAEPRQVDATRRRFGLPARYAALCPGAEYGPAKRWPFFAALAGALDIAVAVLGSANDAEAAHGIAGANLVGRTSLDEAIDLLAGAAFVVSNDSGLMHVAAALGRPQVALFGSSSPRHTPPMSAAARVLWLGVECSPCFQRRCPLGHFRCMRELTVEMVCKEIENLAA